MISHAFTTCFFLKPPYWDAVQLLETCPAVLFGLLGHHLLDLGLFLCSSLHHLCSKSQNFCREIHQKNTTSSWKLAGKLFEFRFETVWNSDFGWFPHVIALFGRFFVLIMFVLQPIQNQHKWRAIGPALPGWGLYHPSLFWRAGPARWQRSEAAVKVKHREVAGGLSWVWGWTHLISGSIIHAVLQICANIS